MSNFKTLLNSKVLRAGAGTGKTTQLVAQVVDIYKKFIKEKNIEPKIVLTTFSIKATEELRERLLSIACEEKNYLFLNYLNSEKILITTIDGLCFKFLTKHAVSIGYPLVIGIAEDKDLNKLIKSYLFSAVHSNKEYLPLLNNFNFNELLQLAQEFYPHWMANSQLTSSRQKHLELSYVYIAKKLLAKKKKLLVKALSPVDLDKKFIDFYQGHLDFINHIQSLSDKDKYLKLEALLLQLNEQFPIIRFSVKSLTDKNTHQAIRENIGDFKQNFLTPDQCGDKNLWLEDEKFQIKLEQLIKQVCKKFEEYKKKEGKISLSDLLLLSLKINKTHPNLGVDFSNNWDCWLIDEYQDTSLAQEQMLSSLIGKAPNIIVGDPQQSIYSFRGSRKEVFERKEQLAKKHDQLSILNINYRSTPDLVYFFNSFFKNFKASFVECLPAPDKTDTAKTEIAKMEAEKTDTETKAKASNIIFSSALSREDELNSIYYRIQKLKAQGVAYDDIGVLARDSNLLKECSVFFEKKSIPFYFKGADSFFELNEIKDLQALLRFLIIPEDNINFIHLLRSPWFAVEDNIIVKGISQLHKKDAYYIYFFKEEAKHKAFIFLSAIINEFNSLGVVHALSFFINNSDLINASLFYDSSGRREANIWKFVSQLVQQSRVSHFNILNSENKQMDLDHLNQEDPASAIFFSGQVQMMTIHKSKGLKFDHVILFGLDKKPRSIKDSGAKTLFILDEENHIWSSPFKPNILKGKICNMQAQQVLMARSQLELEEADRLFYVALTRAAKSLHLSWQRAYKKIKGKESKDKVDLNKLSWAAICENFLAKNNSNILACKLSKDNIYEYKNFSILSQSFDGKLDHKPKHSPKHKSEQSLKHSPEKTLTQNLKTNKIVIKTNIKKNKALKLFTVSEILQLMPKQNQVADQDKATATDQYNTNYHLKKIFKNKVKKGISGNYWHNLLEHLIYLLKKNSKDRAVQKIKSLYSLSKNQITEKDLDKVVAFLFNNTEVPFLEIIKKSFIEWEFQFCFFSQCMIEGKIDLWGWHNNDIWIIDYKFGSSKNFEESFYQLSLYAQAISLKFPNKKIYLALLYPLEQKNKIKSFKPLSKKDVLFTVIANSFDGASV